MRELTPRQTRCWQQHVNARLANKRRARLMDTLAAAFIKQVGTEEASRYMLVEDRTNPHRTSWWFELRRNLPGGQ